MREIILQWSDTAIIDHITGLSDRTWSTYDSGDLTKNLGVTPQGRFVLYDNEEAFSETARARSHVLETMCIFNLDMLNALGSMIKLDEPLKELESYIYERDALASSHLTPLSKKDYNLFNDRVYGVFGQARWCSQHPDAPTLE